VAAELDLNLFPFHRIQGQEMLQLPGLLAMTPPRRTGHGREDDHLLVYLTLSGNTSFSTADYNQFITQTSQRFYQTSGSLTFAMRTAAGVLNQSLLSRNLHTTGKGEYILGRLILGVLRGTQFVFAQCGPTHVFHLTGNETRQFHDEQMGGHGLGVGQAPHCISHKSIYTPAICWCYVPTCQPDGMPHCLGKETFLLRQYAGHF
jgi:hypothetical protein